MSWITENYIEIFGAITGILYVFLEIRQNIWLWPVGILTSAAYIIIFFTGKLYADMGLQVYYLIISIIGWYWWAKNGKRRTAHGTRQTANGERHTADGARHTAEGSGELPSRESLPREPGGVGVGFKETKLIVTHLKFKTGLILLVVWIVIFLLMYMVLERFTDSPVPGWDSFITSLSVIATWMLARKIFEHWYLWVVVNCIASILFFSRGLYPTMVLYIIYGIMSLAGMLEWKKSLRQS